MNSNEIDLNIVPDFGEIAFSETEWQDPVNCLREVFTAVADNMAKEGIDDLRDGTSVRQPISVRDSEGKAVAGYIATIDIIRD